LILLISTHVTIACRSNIICERLVRNATEVQTIIPVVMAHKTYLSEHTDKLECDTHP
jgi:hypothetical protein